MVPHAVPEPIVDLLEVVEIEIGHRERSTVAPCPEDLGVRHLGKGSPVQRSSERVGSCQCALSIQGAPELREQQRGDDEEAETDAGGPVDDQCIRKPFPGKTIREQPARGTGGRNH